MLFSIVCFCLLFIGFLAFRDWIKYRRVHKKRISKVLKKVEKHIFFEQWKLAEMKLRPLYENGVSNKQLWLAFSKVFRGTQRFEEALRWIHYGIRKYPDDLCFKLEEGKILIGLKRWDDAFIAFKKCAPILRQEEDYCLLGKILYHKKQFDEAWLLLSPLIAGTRNGTIVVLAGDALFHLQEYEEAIKVYHLALQKGETSHHLFTQLGTTYQKIGSFREAEIIFRKLLSKNPSDIKATLGLGKCMQEKNFHQKALAIYRSGKAWESGDLSLLQQAGVCALYCHHFAFAEQCFAELLKKIPCTTELLSYFGYSLECQQKWEEAEENYLQMIRLFPDEANGYLALAWIFGVGFSRQILDEQGMKLAYRGLELQPTPLSWEILSACEARIGNFTEAYQIQEYLYTTSQSKKEKGRRQMAMRLLRKHTPLSDTHILRSLVA